MQTRKEKNEEVLTENKIGQNGLKNYVLEALEIKEGVTKHLEKFFPVTKSLNGNLKTSQWVQDLAIKKAHEKRDRKIAMGKGSYPRKAVFK